MQHVQSLSFQPPPLRCSSEFVTRAAGTGKPVESGSLLHHPLPVGSRFGNNERYELLAPIALGGTGVVYAVADRMLDRVLAGKFVIPEEDEPDNRALELEALVTARLEHPNVVMVYDIGEFRGIPFLLMELLRGRALAELVVDRGLPAHRTFPMMRRVCAGLAHAHSRGILHLDLKPGNVHIGDDDSVKLLDFGVGSLRCASLMQRGAVPAAQVVVGTPGYMAPEQWNQSQLGVRTDVWALGVMLYECLTGRLPFPPTFHAHVAGNRKRRPTLPSLEQELDAPVGTDQVLAHTLAHDPLDRYESVEQVSVMLRGLEERAVDMAIRGLTPQECQVAASAELLAPEFQLLDLQLTAAMPAEAVRSAVAKLKRQGVFEQSAPNTFSHFRTASRHLTETCMRRLPTSTRALLFGKTLGTQHRAQPVRIRYDSPAVEVVEAPPAPLSARVAY